MKQKTTNYVAIWRAADNNGVIGNVSFSARSLSSAIAKANTIGREIGLPRSARTIHEGNTAGPIVHEKPYMENPES